MPAYHGVEDAEEMTGDSLAGTVGEDVGLEERVVLIEESSAFGVVFIE